VVRVDLVASVLIRSFFLVTVLQPFAVLSQGEMVEVLKSHGFEQVHLSEEGDTIVILFEHRNFRSPYESVRFASAVVDSALPIRWGVISHNRLIATYGGDGLGYRKPTSGMKRKFNELNDISGGYRFHFRLQPDFAARFGKFDQPVMSKTNLILDTRIYLLPGLSLQGGMLIPIENRLDTQALNVRLSPTHLNYFWEPVDNHYFNVAAGFFFSDRYGLDLQYRYADFVSNWSMGMEASLTGFYFFPPGSLFTGSLDERVLLLDVEYRLPWPYVSVRLSGGQFRFGDRGFRFDAIRQYSSIEFGAFASKTVAGVTAGFQVAFPLFPGSLVRGRRVELRTTDEFRWEYSYDNELPIARRFRLNSPRLSDQLRQYHSSHMRYLHTRKKR
jgi:hypothetical protein